MRYTFLVAIVVLCLNGYSQVGINNPTPDPAAILDIQSNDKGILIPRMTTSDRTMISPAPIGLLVFDDNTESFWMFKTGGWSELSNGDNDKDPNNEKILSINASPTTFTINEGGTTISTPLADNSATNELISNMSISGTSLSINESGNNETVDLRNAIKTYINANCYIYFGWRDNCNGCNTPPLKHGRANGNGVVQITGNDMDAVNATLYGTTIRMVGLNTDGDVDGADKFYVAFECN